MTFASHCNLYILLDRPYQGPAVMEGAPLNCIKLRMRMLPSYEDDELSKSPKRFTKSYFDCPNEKSPNQHATFLPIPLRDGENGYINGNPGEAIFDVHPNLEHIFHTQQICTNPEVLPFQVQDGVRILNTNYLDTVQGHF